MRTKEHDLDQAAYRRLEENINQTYPEGQFVAIYGEMVVGDASELFTLYESLKKAGINPQDALIIQAGHRYPESGVILTVEEIP